MLTRRTLITAIAASGCVSTGSPMPDDAIFELRDYTLRSGQRDVLIDLFEAHFIESQSEVGAHVRGIFRDIDRPDHFVWMRSFADMGARRTALESFYAGPVWRAHREAANATMVAADDVHLLRPLVPPPAEAKLEGALYVVDVLPDMPESELRSAIGDRRDVVAAFKTEPSENDFPALPVHADKVTVVIRSAPTFGQPERLDGLAPPLRTLRLRPTRRSPLQLASPERRRAISTSSPASGACAIAGSRGVTRGRATGRRSRRPTGSGRCSTASRTSTSSIARRRDSKG